MTDTYVPTMPDAVAMHKLRKMVSLSPTLQGRSGLSATGLYDRVFFLTADGDLTDPVVLIDVAESSQKFKAGGGRNFLYPAGSLELIIEFVPNTDYSSENDKRLEAADIMSGIMQDIADLAGADDPSSEDGNGHLTINSITSVSFGMEPARTTVSSTGRRVWCLYQVGWGMGD